MNIYDELIAKTNRDNYPGDYDNGYTLAESISRLIKLIKELNCEVDNNNKIFNQNNLKVEELKKEYLKLCESIDNFKDGKNIPSHSITLDKISYSFFNELDNYINNYIHIENNFVTFGLDDEGNFIACTPNRLNFKFSTDIMGRLVLEF